MTADPVGGVWSYALTLAREFFSSEILLVTMGAPLSPDQRSEIERIRNVTLVETGFRLEWMDDPWEDVDAAGTQLLELESRFAPDIIHLNGYAHAALPWISPVLVVAHSCVLSWWQAVHGNAAPPKYNRYREKVSEGLRSADMVIAPTRTMLCALSQHYAFNGRSRAIPNGCSQPHLTPGVKEPVVIAAGRLWDEAKNYRVLDQAAEHLGWPVLIAGDARHPSGAVCHFDHLHLLDQQSFDSVTYHYQRASIFAHPAHYEPFGLSALEAALCGCALVLGDIESLREVWGNAAVYVPPDDADALHEALSALILSPLQLAEMGRIAREKALGYTAASMANGYQQVYQDLIATQNPEEAPR